MTQGHPRTVPTSSRPTADLLAILAFLVVVALVGRSSRAPCHPLWTAIATALVSERKVWRASGKFGELPDSAAHIGRTGSEHRFYPRWR